MQIWAGEEGLETGVGVVRGAGGVDVEHPDRASAVRSAAAPQRPAVRGWVPMKGR
ncbi:hypothetical protein GCM10017778_54670 [Streptomyces vinaceus]|nr:hypothetical protein GCM10017778_54670 [Streptomyces vinaceus]